MTENLPDTNVGNIEYIRKRDAVDSVAFGITIASAFNNETGERIDLFVKENDELWKAIKRIKALPSADVVQVVHGRWIDDGTEFGCQCSECGKTLDDYVAPTEYASLNEIPNFCPNCGAKMDAQGEE